MSYISELHTTLKLLTVATNICEKHNVLDSLGDEDSLTKLGGMVKFQAGNNAPLPRWIDEIIKKMEEFATVPEKKRAALGAEVGIEEVNKYLAAATLNLMVNYRVANILAAEAV